MKPDALFLPESMKSGATHYERVCSIADIAEAILGLDRSKGERAYIRKQDGDQLFVTGDPHDLIVGALGTPQAGRPRYRWEVQPDGSEWGWLID